MMNIQKPGWAELKSTVTSKGLLMQYEDQGTSYYIYAADGAYVYWFTLQKTSPASEDQTDFETNFKPAANVRAIQLDSDGATMSRTKIAPSGWSYQLRGVEFATSTIGSLVNKDAAGNALTDCTVKLYDASNAEITAAENEASCVKTVLDFEPTYDYYVVGGNIKMDAQPTENVYLFVVGVPDIPEAYGGSKAFAQNINLKHVAKEEGVKADGRAPKWLQYSATLHTNKLRFILKHPAGHKLGIAVWVELFKA